MRRPPRPRLFPYTTLFRSGALINRRQQERVAGMIAAAQAAGVPVLAKGAVAPDAPRTGYYQAPVLFGSVDPEAVIAQRSEEHTSELQSRRDLVCRLLLEKK